MVNVNDLLPEGLEDQLPVAAARATVAMRAVLDTMDAHGYDRVRPPLVEFERSLAGRMADRSGDPCKLFRFTDPASLRTLALRSDITPQVGRIAATSMAGAPRPLRLCYAGEVALIQADQLDPARQRLQIGAELIGSDTVEAASEMVALAIASLETAGASGISVDFTLPDLVDTLSEQALPLEHAQRGAVRRELDTKDAGGLKQAGGEAYLPLLYATGPFDDAIRQLAAIDAGGALASRIAGLKQIAERVQGRARVTLDPTERHGFEYQNWFGFTIYAAGARRAIGRGGTYCIDGSEGGAGAGSRAASNESATGFSLYLEPLTQALAAAHPETAKRNILFLPRGHNRNVAARLRAIGWRTIAALDNGDDARALGCTHRLDGKEAVAL